MANVPVNVAAGAVMQGLRLVDGKAGKTATLEER
jgi:hypothetical protein